MSNERAATVVLVHGAWHGAWCWERVLPLLAEHGVPAVTVDLPTCDESNDVATFEDDAETVRKALDAVDGDVVLVGHSYGGMVITAACAAVPQSVRRLVYLAAFMPDTGESPVTLIATSATPAPILAALRTTDAGRSYVSPESVRDIFYNDCDDQTAAEACARVSTMRPAFEPAGAAIPWRTAPSTYVIANRDGAIPPDVQQRMSQRAGERLEWATGHSPFLSRPDLVAELLVRLAGERA